MKPVHELRLPGLPADPVAVLDEAAAHAADEITAAGWAFTGWIVFRRRVRAAR